MRICYWFLGAAAVCVVTFLVFGVIGPCVTLPLVGILALQVKVALSDDYKDLLNPHIVRGPPDGG